MSMADYQLSTINYPLTVIFIGRSGCGKGTQAKLLIERLKEKNAAAPIFYLETGQTFRELLERGSHTSVLAKEINEQGGLQPEFLAIWAWSHLLVENLHGDERLVIDGTPRKLREAHVLDSALSFYKREKPVIIYLNVSREWSKTRLLERRRGDDAAALIERRLNWFESDVVPAINFFRDNPKYKFVEISGEQSIEQVHTEIISKVL